jgi:hypothetical protein
MKNTQVIPYILTGLLCIFVVYVVFIPRYNPERFTDAPAISSNSSIGQYTTMSQTNESSVVRSKDMYEFDSWLYDNSQTMDDITKQSPLIMKRCYEFHDRIGNLYKPIMSNLPCYNVSFSLLTNDFNDVLSTIKNTIKNKAPAKLPLAGPVFVLLFQTPRMVDNARNPQASQTFQIDPNVYNSPYVDANSQPPTINGSIYHFGIIIFDSYNTDKTLKKPTDARFSSNINSLSNHDFGTLPVWYSASTDNQCFIGGSLGSSDVGKNYVAGCASSLNWWPDPMTKSSGNTVYARTPSKYATGDQSTSPKGNIAKYNNSCYDPKGSTATKPTDWSYGILYMFNDQPNNYKMVVNSHPGALFNNPRGGLLKMMDPGLTGKCVAVKDGMNQKGKLGLPIIMTDCPTDTTDPNFQFKQVGNTIKWINDGTYTNQCISSSKDPNHIKNGTTLITDSCKYNQKFVINNKLGNIGTALKNTCMDALGALGNKTGKVSMGFWQCTKSPNQKISYQQS